MEELLDYLVADDSLAGFYRVRINCKARRAFTGAVRSKRVNKDVGIKKEPIVHSSRPG